MREREQVVVAVLVAAPLGRLTSRVRLQKVVYLLDRLGFDSGFEFEYHHYGPYSRVLDNAAADAKALKLIEERTEFRVRDGASYSIFELTDKRTPDKTNFGTLGYDKAKEHIAGFAETNLTVLELAATVDFLWHKEKVSDWRGEVGKRKGVKVEGGRLEKAIALLGRIGLEPPSSDARS